MENSPKTFELDKVIDKKTLNTFTFETWLNHWKSLDKICHRKIHWSEIDKKWWFDSEFSIKNRIEAWWENYKENNIVFTQWIDWDINQVNLPSIWWGWMWIDISSLSLLNATSIRTSNWLWFCVSSHLSSIWMWSFVSPNLFENNWEWFEKYWKIIEKEFYELFEEKLWLTKENIEQHFLKTDSYSELDSSFQPSNKNWEIFLMKDLIALYNNVSIAKEKWLFVSINHMYKSTWYLASIKVATLAWADAITTWAWIPRNKNNEFVNPKDIVIDFWESIWIIESKVPAFWLIVSLTMAYAPWYDYYIDEDPRNAWWHQWAFESMLKFKKRVWKESVLKSLRKREGINENVPIYAAWWIQSAADIKELFDMWFDWVQLWTNFAVSKEARNWEWENFKESLISWNHYWKETEIDEIAKKTITELKKNLEWEVKIFRKKFVDILQINEIIDEQESDLWFLNWDKIISELETEIFWRDFWPQNELVLTDKVMYNMISKKLYKKYNWNIEDLRKDLRLYWNLLKAVKEFEKFANLEEIPTHLLFDSVVWFIGRLRINGWEYRLLNGTVLKSIKCVQCVTSCLLRDRWVSKNKWSHFCISDSLRIWNRDSDKSLILNFSWKTTCFYSEIRPIKDILLAYMWTEVIRD